MIVSLNPTYLCNFRCKFCYLTKEQLSDKKFLPLKRMEEMLTEVNAWRQIQHVDLYGGEVQLLDESYLLEVLGMAERLGIDSVSLITNLSIVRDIIYDKRLNLTVSYDFQARQDSDVVFSNMLSLDRSFSVLTLASREFLDAVSVDEFVNTFNMLKNVESVEIKPYSKNQANSEVVRNDEFEKYVWAVLTHPDRDFHFQNETNIDEAANKERNSYSDDHVYVTPAGTFAVLDFDENDKEYFRQLGSLSEYQEWASQEKVKVNSNVVCSSCEYNGHCLSEHLREVKEDGDSCNGFKNLILKWVEEDE